MLKKTTAFAVLSLLIAATVWAQCPAGTTAVIADRTNTLYEDATGMLSNGSGEYIFSGRTAQGGDEIRRGLVHFDVRSAVMEGSTIARATLQMIVNQPQNNGTHATSLHRVTQDWGAGASQGGMGEGGGGQAMTNDATWLNTFFNTGTWTNPGGDFDANGSASIMVAGSAGTYSWTSLAVTADAQSWLDVPAENFGWLIQGNESSSTTAHRFGSALNEGSEPTLCLEVCPDMTDCTTFSDGFESGDVTAWSGTS